VQGGIIVATLPLTTILSLQFSWWVVPIIWALLPIIGAVLPTLVGGNFTEQRA